MNSRSELFDIGGPGRDTKAAGLLCSPFVVGAQENESCQTAEQTIGAMAFLRGGTWRGAWRSCARRAERFACAGSRRPAWPTSQAPRPFFHRIFNTISLARHQLPSFARPITWTRRA